MNAIDRAWLVQLMEAERFPKGFFLKRSLPARRWSSRSYRR